MNGIALEINIIDGLIDSIINSTNDVINKIDSCIKWRNNNMHTVMSSEIIKIGTIGYISQMYTYMNKSDSFIEDLSYLLHLIS